MSQHIGLEWATQTPENNKNCCCSELGMFLQFCYFTVDAFFMLTLFIFDDDFPWWLVCTVFPKVHSMWLLQSDRKFKDANVADNGKSVEHLMRWLFGPWEEVTWLEEINWTQLEKISSRSDCVLCSMSTSDRGVSSMFVCIYLLLYPHLHNSNSNIILLYCCL